MESKKFDIIEHEIIYNKMMSYCNEITAETNKNAPEIKESYSEKLVEVNNHVSIDTMREYKELYAHRLIRSHRKYIGNMIIFCKKVVRKCLKWYINPITEHQTIFNNAVLDSVEFLLKKLNNVESENKNLSVKITELGNKVERIANLDCEVAKIAQLENQVTRIAELEKQVSRIAELESQDARIAELEKQVSRIPELESQDVRIAELEKQVLRIPELESQVARIAELESQVKKVNEVFKLELCNEHSFFEKKSYSQAGEDTILAYIFFTLGIKNEEITYLDLGANHAKELSNTYYFYENRAKGVLVEANPKLIQELSFYRHNDVILNSLVSEKDDEEMDFYILSGDGLSTPDKEQAMEACRINPNISVESTVKVKSVTVNNIIEKYFGGITPKFISIDIEGHDLEVIKSIDLDKYRPLVIAVETIEYRPYLSINIKKNEVIEYLKTKEYVEYAFTGINSILIDSKYMKSLGQEG